MGVISYLKNLLSAGEPPLQVTVTVAGSSPGSVAEPLDQVRAALRGIEWN
jgi:hypothetical protein